MVISLALFFLAEMGLHIYIYKYFDINEVAVNSVYRLELTMFPAENARDAHSHLLKTTGLDRTRLACSPCFLFVIQAVATYSSYRTFPPLFMKAKAYFVKCFKFNLYSFSPSHSLLTLVFYTNMYCSILTMMAIGIDRYLGIVRPMLFRESRERKSLAVISCLFMWGLVLGVLYPLMTTDLTFDIPELGITTCFDVLKKHMLSSLSAWVTFLFGMIFVLFLLPFFVTTFCYVSVIRKLARDSKTAQKDRAIRLAFIVLSVFIVCFAPNNILLLIHCVLRLFYNKSVYMAYKLSLCFSCLNSCLDPFIYYFASKDFRQKLRHIMNLHSLSSVDSMKAEHRASLYSANWTPESRDGEHSKVSLMTLNTAANRNEVSVSES